MISVMSSNRWFRVVAMHVQPGGHYRAQTTLNVTSPIDGTPVNLPSDSAGNLITSRSLPKNAGFGAANAYQVPRTLQVRLRFSF